jgi:hypothetical protein
MGTTKTLSFQNMTIQSLAQAIAAQLIEQSEGPYLFQGGHFTLEAWHNGDAMEIYPMVPEELERTAAPKKVLQAALQKYGAFPRTTFEIAIEAIWILREKGRRASLITMVNDWDTSIRKCPEGLKARESFYQNHGTLATYQEMLDSNDIRVGRSFLTPNGTSLLSETRLRHAFKRRIEGLKKRGDLGLEGSVEYSAGTLQIEGLSCPILRGQATCAGEVAELHLRAKMVGYKALVNLYPVVCQGFVRESRQIAERLWGLEDYLTLDIPFPCAEQMTAQELLVDLCVEIQT